VESFNLIIPGSFWVYKMIDVTAVTAKKVELALVKNLNHKPSIKKPLKKIKPNPKNKKTMTKSQLEKQPRNHLNNKT